MRVCPLSTAPHLYPSDTEGTHARRAGMRELRHKLRHKLGIFRPSSPKLTLGVTACCPGVRGHADAWTGFSPLMQKKQKIRATRITCRGHCDLAIPPGSLAYSIRFFISPMRFPASQQRSGRELICNYASPFGVKQNRNLLALRAALVNRISGSL